MRRALFVLADLTPRESGFRDSGHEVARACLRCYPIPCGAASKRQALDMTTQISVVIMVDILPKRQRLREPSPNVGDLLGQNRNPRTAVAFHLTHTISDFSGTMCRLRS
jgi:hypothetical protein